MSVEKAPISVEDSIKAAFDEIEEKEINEQVDTPGGDNEPTEKVETRERGDDGKFVKKAKKKDEKEVEEASEEEIKAQPEKPKYKAPKSWETDATLRADYDKLPDHIKQALDKREKEVEHGFTRLDEERNFGKQLKEVITPYMPIITAEGGNPVAAVQSLLNTAYQLRTAPQAQKAQLIQQIAQQYGVDLGHLPQTEAIDPAYKALMDKINGLESTITQQSTLQQQQEHYKIQSEIQAFAANPANTYFEQVKAAMAPLLGSGQARDLQEAYDKACWATPEIRTILIAAQEKELFEKRKQEIAKKKQASVSVTGSPGHKANAGKSTKTLEEELGDVYDDLTGSAI